jgi:hypothetical protein
VKITRHIGITYEISKKKVASFESCYLRPAKTNNTKQQVVLYLCPICVYSRGGNSIKCVVPDLRTDVVAPEISNFFVS